MQRSHFLPDLQCEIAGCPYKTKRRDYLKSHTAKVHTSSANADAPWNRKYNKEIIKYEETKI